ncbi:NAD-dependent epimerase [Leptothoe kymatousa]|uniref:NAD-dependent epimerase n=1 Tax=Leptothoe kymatousa TAU-MAC 1615 TaxID=2364775 RepID=A0ABS5Y3R6_9CYAN|nr:NAD-dependent epimerase [Leptothoe kymatousa]MBT9312461.1 NAD-dependent epimerase [Leptothoe kymatousa TAU-MAC 1615]
MQILVTGVAGFIGYFTAWNLLDNGHTIYGIDNLNSYYDVQLKKERLLRLKKQSEFTFQLIDISNREAIQYLFQEHSFDTVIHLAAQAGVRYSLENPFAYGDSNLSGFLNILEGCRSQKINHLIYASSSSVYGMNKKIPFSVKDNVDYPISLYAATKKANELMAHSYSHLYQIPTTGLRFFTVYGPWGRPDMAYFKFVRAIEAGQPIDIYNHGQMQRDFTYIDDIVEGIIRLVNKPPQSKATEGTAAPYKIYNIGNNRPVTLLKFIETIEQTLGKTANKNFLPMQPGDVPLTYADIDELAKDIDFAPLTPLEIGIGRFVQWYRHYYSAVSVV